MSSQEQEVVKLEKLENSLLIRQANAITESRHALSATEQNIMYMVISQIRNDDPIGKVYSIRMPELEKLTNKPIDYSHLKEASQKLIGKVFRVRIDNEITEFAPLNFFMYKKRKAIIELKISDEIRPFFFALKNNYTLFKFQTALKLKSKYSKRMYEMLCQFKKSPSKKMYISVQELKERFELFDPKTGKEEYSNFNLFATKVLEVAKKEINEHTDISFEYITKKTGRKITELEFEITIKEVVKGLAESSDVDPQVVELKERLVKKFQLSKTLAKTIIENIPLREVNKILHDIQLEDSAKKIRKIGAYATTVFQNRLDGVSLVSYKPNSLKYTSPKMQIENSVSQQENLEEEEKPIEYQKSIVTNRSNSSASIGDLLAQIGAPKKVERMDIAFSKEEKEAKAAKAKEKYLVWRKLYNDFRIDYAEVDSLMAEHSLEDLKEAISKVEEELKDQENPQEYGQMIQMLKKHLDLA
jgi:plasmid replication initiation protein